MTIVEGIVAIGAYKANAFNASGMYIHRAVQSDQSRASTTNASRANEAYVYPDIIATNPSTSPTMFHFLSPNQTPPIFNQQELDHSSTRLQVLQVPGYYG